MTGKWKTQSARGLVFDFGGVITACASPVKVKAIVDRLGLPWQAVLDGYAKYRREYDLGDITIAEFYDRTWRAAGVAVPPAARAEMEEADTASFLVRNDRTVEWLRSLKARGFALGILTNMPRELAPRFKAGFADVLSLVDALVVSCEEHVVKPMREIYDLAAARIGLPAGELVFFDDSEANCEGARAAGWRAIRFTGNDQAEADLERLLGAGG